MLFCFALKKAVDKLLASRGIRPVVFADDISIPIPSSTDTAHLGREVRVGLQHGLCFLKVAKSQVAE
jgi:hypothetical protein